MSTHRLALALAAALILGCGDGPNPVDNDGSEDPVASIEISPAAVLLEEHESVILSATTLDARGRLTTPRTVHWRSLDFEVAGVPEFSGEVYGAGPGETRIVATVEEVADTIDVTVTPATVHSVAIESPLADTVLLRAAGRLTATPLDGGGIPLLGRTAEWSSEAPGVATVAPDGLVEAVGVGTATITATIEGVSATAQFRVETATFTAIAAGAEHDCAIDTTGRLWCWGGGARGQLGRGDTLDRDTPSQAAGTLRFSRVTAGEAHTCGITTGGQAMCWGDNREGGVGDGTTEDALLPVEVSGGHGFTAVSAGWRFSCGVTPALEGFCWGTGDDRKLGQPGPGEPSSIPLRAIEDTTFTAIETGSRNACGINTLGQAICWGDDSFGQRGTETGDIGPVPDLTFTSLTLGIYHVCGLTGAGEGHCWGQAQLGALGDAGTDPFGPPRPIAGGHAFSQLAAGEEFTCGVTTDGALYCWGNGSAGSLGSGNLNNVRSPEPISSQETFTAVSARGLHACGLTDQGVVYCWGMRYGVVANLGDGLHTSSDTPIRIPGK